MNAMEVAVFLPVTVSAPSTLVVELLNNLACLSDGRSVQVEAVESRDATDSLMPVWDDEVWQLFVDLALYRVGDLPADVGDMSPTAWARGLVRWAIETAVENMGSLESGNDI